jgi:hypothetical protein
MGSLGYLGATGRASASRVVERRQIARPADSELRASGGGGVTPLTVRGDGSRCSGRSESWVCEPSSDKGAPQQPRWLRSRGLAVGL